MLSPHSIIRITQPCLDPGAIYREAGPGGEEAGTYLWIRMLFTDPGPTGVKVDGGLVQFCPGECLGH